MSTLQNIWKWTDARPNLNQFERRRGAAQRQIHAQTSVAVSGERKSPSKLRRSCPVIIHVRPVRNGRTVTYTRPVNELILLVNMP